MKKAFVNLEQVALVDHTKKNALRPAYVTLTMCKTLNTRTVRRNDKMMID